MGMGNTGVPGSTEAILGLHGCCRQTRKGESEDGTEAADLGACSMVGGGAGGVADRGWCSQDGAHANERGKPGLFLHLRL